MTDNDRLTPKQQAVLAALLSGATQAEAARAAGVGEKTVWRWRREPAFEAALRAGGAELVAAALRNLSALAQPAAATLGAILADDSASTSAKLKAAGIVFDNLLRLREQVDLAERIAALEGIADGAEPK